MAKLDLVYTEIMHESVANTRYGEMTYYSGDSYIGWSLEKYGEYSELEVELWRKLVEPGDHVVDIGANIGALTLPLSVLVGPTGKVTAFEPHRELSRLLIKNTGARNNIYAKTMGVGSRSEKRNLPRLSELGHKNYGHVVIGSSGGQECYVDTLDDSVSGRVDFIKIDVEGMEDEVLLGAVEIISDSRPIIYMEFNRDEKRGTLVRLLRSYNYSCWIHNPPLFNPRNFNGDQENVFDNTVSFNLLCIPSEKVKDYKEATEDLSRLKTLSHTKSQWVGVARMGGVGDNLIAASVCRPLKRAGYMVEVISQPPFSELFENNPYVDKLSVHGDWPKDQGAWQAWFSNRAEEYDKFVNLSHSVEILHAVFPASTEFWWPEKFRRKRLGGSYLESTHDLFDMPYDFGPLFFPTEEETDLAVATRIKFGAKPLVAWCISGTRIDKTHPMAPQVISRLIRELGANVVMFGRSHPHYDYTLASQVMDMVEVHNGNRDGLHFAGGLEADGARWPIRRVLTQVANCDLVIGPDTGPMWAVAFEYVPKIMLHSHASVENITKHWVNTTSLAANPQRVPCWPCHRLHDNFSTCRLNKWNNGAACISDISVDAILTAARELLRC